jgi:peroxiredoxin
VENPVPATREWQLRSEPWVFVIDRQGRIAAKFEGIMALEEVEAALLAVLGQ